MGFFGIPNPESRSRGFPTNWIRQLNRYLFIIERTFWCQEFGLKISKFPSEIRNTFKKFWVLTVFWPDSDHRDYFESQDLCPRDSGFLECRYFHPRDFLKIPGIYKKASGVGIFSGFFIPGIGICFRGMGYPDKNPTVAICKIRYCVRSVKMISDINVFSKQF